MGVLKTLTHPNDQCIIVDIVLALWVKLKNLYPPSTHYRYVFYSYVNINKEEVFGKTTKKNFPSNCFDPQFSTDGTDRVLTHFFA